MAGVSAVEKTTIVRKQKPFHICMLAAYRCVYVILPYLPPVSPILDKFEYLPFRALSHFPSRLSILLHFITLYTLFR